MDERAPGRRGADLLVLLRDLGDDLLADRPPGADPVAGALRDIGAAPSGVGARPAESGSAAVEAGAAGARSSVRLRSARSPRWPRPSRRVAVAVLAGAVAACLLAVAAPGPRGAVAGLLGIGGVRVVPGDELPGAGPRVEADDSDPSDRRDDAGEGGDTAGSGSGSGSDEILLDDLARNLGLGESLPVDEALLAAPAPMQVGGVGDADAAFTGLPEGAVTLAWAADADLPVVEATAPTGWGLILTAFPGTTEAPTIFKAPAPLTTVTAVTVDGRSGYWVADRPHSVVVVGPDNKPANMPARLAGNTLLWTVGDVTYRLESALDRDAAIALAETIPTPPG